MRITKLRISIFFLVVLLGVAGNIPYATISVPEWRLKVVNKQNIPQAGREVRQTWNNYSLDFSELDEKEETKVSDGEGIVVFPSRTDSASFFHRILGKGADLIKPLILHSSKGIQAYIFALDDSDSDITYEGQGALPNVLVIDD